MINGIVDSTVIIHLYRRNAPALAWFSTQAEPLAITPITWMEIIYGAGSAAKIVACQTILDQFEMEYPSRTDIDWAMQQMKRYRLSHGATMNDCLIASVCFRLQVPLYTHNLKDMSILVGSRLAVKPY